MTEDDFGYVYIDVKEESNSADIEFLGTKVSERGKGYGYALLSKALEWIFSNDNMTEISLYMLKNNPVVRLYEKVGFNIEGKAYSYSLNLNPNNR